MKTKKYINSKITLVISFIFIAFLSCERDTSNNLELATYPSTAEVFIDGFSSGLEYYPFADSKQTAFSVDDEVKYKGTASMRFDIPNYGDPEGAYAGAIFRDDNGGRDLSGYDALTFWAKGSQSATINEVGYGNDFDENKYLVSLQNLSLTTNWVKYIIPIPDASKLSQEKGMFWYAEGPEDGKGYTFWIDELKFEKLGTIAQPRPAILNGIDEEEQSFIGSTIKLGGLTQTFNLPSGYDIAVNAAPGYYEFSSSNPSVAAVDENGLVSVISSGTTIVSAYLGDDEAAGSLTIESLGDFEPAPTPTQEPGDVISIFSNAYTNEPVEYYNGYWAPYQTTQGQDDISINGDDIIKYSELNFVGIQFTEPTINISEMTHFHLDINVQAPNPIDAEDFLTIKLQDIGPDNTFGTTDDSFHELTFTSPTLVSGSWVSLDLPLSSFSNLTSRANLAQVVFVSDATITDILVDNIYFYKGAGGPSGTGATSLPIDFETGPTGASTLFQVFEDTTPPLEVVSNPDMSGVNTSSTVAKFVAPFPGPDYAGTVTKLTAPFTLDASNSIVKIMVWKPVISDVGIKFESDGASTGEIKIPNTVVNQWEEITFDFSSRIGAPSSTNIDAIVVFPDFDARTQENTIYFDNISLSASNGGGGGGNATEPTEAAPTPTQDAADVISIYSDAYSSIEGTDYNPGWGQATVVSEVAIAGNNTFLYSGLNYQGIALGSSQDISGMDYMHIDVWTANSTALNAFLISSGPVETGKSLSVPTSGWLSVDIPLSEFSPVDLADLIQLKFDGDGDIYLDNIYFYKESTGNATEPTEAAPTPTQDAADVISIYSDAYSSIEGTDYNPGWGQATVVSEVAIEGNNTFLYSGLNYQGIALGSSQDISGMDYMHIDIWTANSTALNAFLISSGPVETGKSLSVPTSGWLPVDIPLSEFSPVDLADLIQLKFDGDGDIYLDNIYFYKESTGNATEPTEAAPTPTQDAADVISVYSDAYSSIEGTDYNPGWGQATVVSEVAIAGNNTFLYSGLNYQGIALGSSQDISGMDYMHIDIWTANSTALNAFLISSGPVETAKSLSVPTSGWLPVDIPLSEFSPVDLADLIQLKFDGDGDIYLDNIYFYKESTGGVTDYSLNLPIDFESSGFGASWNWNVFENDTNQPIEFVENPDASGINTSATVAKITALQSGQPWVGCETAHGQMGITFNLDASNTTVKIMVYKSVISDIGIKFATPAGGAQPELKVANTLVNQWEEITFDFSSYIGLGDTTGLDQIIIFPDFDLAGRTSDNVVYFDNITFN